MKVYAPIDVLPTAEFYAREHEYLTRVDPPFDKEDIASNLVEEQALLENALGAAGGREVLDVTCGGGSQVLALASLGWKTFGLDLTPEYLMLCAARIREFSLEATVAQHDITQQLPDNLLNAFDAVISCMALDNLPNEASVRGALVNMASALKQGGVMYIRLRDMDFILDEEDPVTLGEARPLPNGRLTRAEHFLPLDDGGIVHSYYYFLEDHSSGGYPNSTAVFSQRRLALRRARLLELMAEAGMHNLRVLPRAGGWVPYEVLAEKA